MPDTTNPIPLPRLVTALDLDDGDYHDGVHGYAGGTLDGDTLTLRYERSDDVLPVPGDLDTTYTSAEYHFRLTRRVTEEPSTPGTVVLAGRNVYVRDDDEPGQPAWADTATLADVDNWADGTHTWNTWTDVIAAAPDGRVLVLHTPGASYE